MTLEALLRRVVAILDDTGIPYMLTGSIAAAYHAEPRTTRAIDLVIAVSADEIGDLLGRLDAEGFYVSHEAAREAVRRRGQFNAIDPESGWKVDWIVRKDRPFSRSEFERRQRVELMDLKLPIVGGRPDRRQARMGPEGGFRAAAPGRAGDSPPPGARTRPRPHRPLGR